MYYYYVFAPACGEMSANRTTMLRVVPTWPGMTWPIMMTKIIITVYIVK